MIVITDRTNWGYSYQVYSILETYIVFSAMQQLGKNVAKKKLFCIIFFWFDGLLSWQDAETAWVNIFKSGLPDRFPWAKNTSELKTWITEASHRTDFGELQNVSIPGWTPGVQRLPRAVLGVREGLMTAGTGLPSQDSLQISSQITQVYCSCPY